MEALPDELKLQIIENLLERGTSLKNLQALCRTSREFYSLCQDERIWREVYRTIDPSATHPPLETWRQSVLENYLVSDEELRKGIDTLEEDVINFLNRERERKPRIPPYENQLDKAEAYQALKYLLSVPQLHHIYGRWYIVGDPSTFYLPLRNTIQYLIHAIGLNPDDYTLYKDRGLRYALRIEDVLSSIIDPHHHLHFITIGSDGYPLSDEDKYFILPL